MKKDMDLNLMYSSKHSHLKNRTEAKFSLKLPDLAKPVILLALLPI
jgi:hypothetical protein